MIVVDITMHMYDNCLVIVTILSVNVTITRALNQ